MITIKVIAATRLNEVSFWRHSKLGLSLRKLTFDNRIVHSIAFENSSGLPVIYNRAIRESAPDEILVLAHDDIYIDDFLLRNRLEEALADNDVIGVAGNARLRECHVGWFFWREKGEAPLQQEDSSFWSGAIANFTPRGEHVSFFGATPRRCELLDGCFLAFRARTALHNKLLFDEQFSFHFYDVDFSRTCRKLGLTLSTWPIAITHSSGGSFGHPAWGRL